MKEEEDTESPVGKVNVAVFFSSSLLPWSLVSVQLDCCWLHSPSLGVLAGASVF